MKRLKRSLSLLLLAAWCASCHADHENASNALVVVNAPQSGTVRRVLTSENVDVPKDAVLIEISVPDNPTNPVNNIRPPEAATPDPEKAIAAAQRDLERAAVEVQRVESLVASNSAPPSQLDAARVQYQRAQERLDQLRRGPPIPSAKTVSPENENPTQSSQTTENIISVRAPVTGNVRVISVRTGQRVRAGQPVATLTGAPLD
jgi:biotin carboxyl carrier protein